MVKNKSMLFLYILFDIILMGAFICAYREFGISTQRDQIFLGIIGLGSITGIVSTIRLWIKIKKNR